MRTMLLVPGGLAGAVYAVHLWFDPQTLRGRWRGIFPDRNIVNWKDS